MTFGEMINALRRFWFVVVIFTVAALVVAAAAAILPETKYEARATLLAQPESEVVDFASVEAVRFILPSLAQLVSTNTFRAQVGRQLDPALPSSEVDAEAEFEPGTGIVHVTGTDADPVLAQEIAQVSAELLGSQDLSAAVKITVLDPPELPTSEAGPGTGAYLLGGFVLGLLGGALLAIILAVAGKARAESAAGVAPASSSARSQEPQTGEGGAGAPYQPKGGEGQAGDAGQSGPTAGQAALHAATLAAEPTESLEQQFEPSWKSLDWFNAAAGSESAATEIVRAKDRPGVSPELEERLTELGLDVLACIPIKGEHAAGHATQNGAHDFDGAFRALAERLADRAERHPALAVTSPRGGAGRTTVVANVAWTLAAMGRPVVAADGDVEGPMLHRFLRVHERPGLVDLADGQLDQVCQETALPGLAVVAGGGASDASAPALEQATAKLVHARGGELVVIDAPALLDSPGQATAVRASGAVLLVLDAADARAVDDVAASASRLEALGVEIVGVVLNRACP